MVTKAGKMAGSGTQIMAGRSNGSLPAMMWMVVMMIVVKVWR